MAIHRIIVAITPDAQRAALLSGGTGERIRYFTPGPELVPVLLAAGADISDDGSLTLTSDGVRIASDWTGWAHSSARLLPRVPETPMDAIGLITADTQHILDESNIAAHRALDALTAWTGNAWGAENLAHEARTARDLPPDEAELIARRGAAA